MLMNGVCVCQGAAKGTWQTYTHKIPKFGGTSYNTTKLSKKVTISKSASFKATTEVPALGTWIRLISKQKNDRSDAAKLVTKNKIVLAKCDEDKGEYVGDKVSSNVLEPNNTHVTVKFSADNLS